MSVIKVSLFVIFEIFLIAVGFGGGYYANRNIANTALQQVNTDLTTNLEQVKAELPIIPEIHSFEGVVESVLGNIVTIKVDASTNPFDKWQTERTIAVTVDTKILHTGIKTPDVLKKEFDKNKKITSVFFEESLSIESLKPGLRVKVESGDNIKDKTSFTADSILFDESTLATSSAPIVTGGGSLLPTSSPTSGSPTSKPTGTGTSGTSTTIKPPTTSTSTSGSTLPPPPTTTNTTTSTTSTSTSGSNLPPPPTPVPTGGTTTPPPPPTPVPSS